MSKAKPKKELNNLTKEQLVEQILDLYDKNNAVKEFYDSAYNNYKTALEFMAKNKLLVEFKLRAEQCVKWASLCGYGFADDIVEVFYDYYGE